MQKRSSAGVLQSRCFQKFYQIHRKIPAPVSFFHELQEEGLKPATLLSFQNFEEHLSHRTAVEDCFWMYQNITAIKLTKSYKESGSIGRSKLFLPTHINYQSGTLVEGFLNHVIKSFTQLLYLILDRISIFSFSKRFLKICKTTCFLFLNILTQGKLFVAFRRRRLLN